MIDDNKLKKIYSTLQQGGYSQDFDSFKKGFTGNNNYSNRKQVYDLLSANGAQIGNTYKEFMDSIQKPKAGKTPMTAEDRARFSAGAKAISASAQQTMNNAGRYNKLKQQKQKQQSDFGRVNLGTKRTPFAKEDNVVKDDFAYNPTTGETGTYVTSDNQETDNLYEAQGKQAALDEYNKEYQNAVDTGEIASVFDVRDKDGNYDLQENIGKDGAYLTEEGAQNQLERKLDDAYVRKKEIEDAIAKDNQENGNPLLSYSGSIGAGNGRNAENSDYRNKLATSLSLVKQQIGALEAVKQYPTSSWVEDAWKALDNTAFTAKTWDFGLTDFAVMGQMERIKAKMDNKIPLTDSDKMLLKSKLGSDAAAALEDEKMGNIYRWTKIAGQSLPFMLDFFLTGGYSGAAKTLGTAALKYAAKRGMGTLGKNVLKYTGVTVGNVVSSYAMAGTEQAFKTGADIMQRHLGTLYQDENGNYGFGTFDENGNLLHDGGESIGSALYKGLTSAMVENYTEKFFHHTHFKRFLGQKMAGTKLGTWLSKVGTKGWYANSKNIMKKFGIDGFGEEVMEEEIGIPLHALLDGDNKMSDLVDAKQQLDIVGGMALSVGSMALATGGGSAAAKSAYRRGQYYRFKHLVDVSDNEAQQLFTDDAWEKLKEQIDNTTNEKMGGMLYSVLQSKNTMSKEQIDAAVKYGVNLMKMRGYNLASTMQMQARETTNEPTTPEEEREQNLDDAYSEGHNAEGADTHTIQLEQNESATALAGLLGITEEKLHNMSDDELDAMTGQNDQLDEAIYDYQMSTARYQGVMDNANDKVDMAARRAAIGVDQTTDLSRGSVRNATIKATKGEKDYGVYIISGHIATNEDGTINIADSDKMILYYDPKTRRKDYADASRFASLGEEVPADQVKAQAVADAKEKAIKEVSGIIDGRVEEGSEFTVTDEQGNEHTYEVLADNGDGTAMITIDGNVEYNPYSLNDLQLMKDAEDKKRLEAAKAEREQYEQAREQQKKEKEQAQVQDDEQLRAQYNNLLDNDGKVVMGTVHDGKHDDLQAFIIGVNQSNKKPYVVFLNEDGSFTKPRTFKADQVERGESVDYETFKAMMPSATEEESSTVEEDRGEEESLGDELPPVPDNVTINGDGTYSVDGERQGEQETSEAPSITLSDGTIVPIKEDGNPDFSQLTAEQTAELYDTQFGDDADQVINGWVEDAKKALDKATNMTVKGKNFVEQKASKEAKDKAIADAQAAYDSASAIRDAYKERQIAQEENTAEGRKNLIEKARRKYNRLKVSVKDNAQATLQLYQDTVGSLLHRLYDGTGIDVFDDTPNTVDEYVASSVAPYSLNYEGNENSKGVQQETGLSRSDFAKLGWLAANGKGTTVDAMVHKLWDNRPSNLENVGTQEIRSALLNLITSGQTAFESRNYIQNNRIAQAENILEEQERAAAESETENTPSENTIQPAGTSVENNTEVPADATDEKPLGEQQDSAPFSARKNAEEGILTNREEYVENNRVENIKTVDYIVGKKMRKTLERIAKMMGAKIQWQYSDKTGNGWYDANTNTIYLALDSSITEGVQFIFGHEVTHEIKSKNPEAYEELRGLVKEMMGEDSFDSMTDATQKRYNDARIFYIEGRPAYEEEVVADQMGHWLQDANYAHTLAMKMSHPLLAKLHEIVNRIKMAFTGTEYTDNAKIILRSIEQAYVKTANGTFESPDTGVRHSLKEANERFNNEIENFKNKSHKGLMHLGAPSPILKACGVNADEITLSPKVLNKKLNQHSLTSDDAKDLVNAIQKPIMVYKHGEKSPNIVVVTNANVRGNKLSLALELDTDGNVREMNNVSSIHDKDAETEVKRWLSWDEGYLENALRWVDKEKVSDWLSSARLNSYSQTEYNQKLSSLAKVLNNFENPKVSEENLHDDVEKVQYSLRQKPEPTKKGIGYKVFVLKDGKLYPPMVANPNGAETPVGVWLDADAAPIAGESKTGRPQVKQGGKGTQGGSGKLAYRPGWHLGVIPYALQFNRKDAEGNKTLFPANFVFAEVEYAADKDYQDEAHAEGVNENGKYQHSLAGLKHLPTDGYYMYRTNPNPETDPWVITGAMKVNRILTRTEQAELVKNAGREPQIIQDGDIVTDDVVNTINQQIANAPKFSLKVYHGSGADFTEFDFKHMGEGAGSQAFGWGGYVTSSKKIGKDYANIKYDPDKDVEYVGKNKKPFTDLIATLFDGGIRDYDYVKNTLQEISDKDKSNISKKEEYDWFVSTKPEDWFNPNPKTNRNLYEVNIPDDNGKNYLGWDEPLTDEQRKIIYNGLVAKNIKSPDLIVNAKMNIGTKLVPKFRAVYDLLSTAYNLGGIQNASQFLSSLGFTGIKYKAGTIMGGAEEGDVNYVIFKPEDMQIAEHTKFSLKGNVDNQGNPLNADGTLKLDKIKSVADLTDKDFTNATRNVLLPAVPKNVDSAIGANGKPVIIKKNIFQKNWNAHKFTPAESRKVLNDALYNTDLVGRSQPTKKPNHWVAIKLDEKSPITVLEVNDNKDNVEIVGWYTLDERNLGRIKRQAERNGGELIMLSPIDKVESLSTPSLNSAAKIDNSSETAKENGEKVDSEDPKTFDEFLEHPSMKFSIKNEEQRKAAENAYNWAAENRPDKYNQYAIVDMDEPNRMPEYFEKKALAEQWRKYYTNKWKIGNYKAFDLDKPFEEQVKNVKGNVPDEFDPHKKDAAQDQKIAIQKQLAEAEKQLDAIYEMRKNRQKQLLRQYMDKNLLSSTSDVPDKALAEIRLIAVKEYRPAIQELFDKCVNLDNQLQTMEAAESDVKFSLKEVNDKFNDRLEELIKNPNQKDKILRLGHASTFLQDGGIADADIELEFDKFVRKSDEDYKNQHPFDADDLKNMPLALAEPIAVFESTNANDHVVLTELQKDGKNFIVAIRTVSQNRKGGVVLEVNQITSLYPKKERGIVHWINTGRISNVNEEKALHFIEALQPHAGTTITSEELETAAKVIKDYESSKENAEKSSMSIEESIEDFASRYGVDMLHVATYADAMKRKDVHTANWAMASMRVALRHKNSNLKLSEFKNVLKPIQEELYARFGNMDDLQKQYEQQVAAERNVMEAARKKAEEEENKHQKHLEELAQLSDAEIDKKYMDSLEKGDESMAREMLDESARRKGYGDANSDYQGVGAWAAPSNPGYETDEERRADVADNAPDVNLEDMALGYSKQPDDYFENPRAYGQDTTHGLESTKAIKTALDALKRGEKDVKVKVYRAVPTSIKEGKLHNGDWVTPSKTYADMHGNSRLEGKYRIIEDEVPANQLWWDGNDANEFGFDDGKEYKYKNAKNNRKLNDLVTRDDKGNIIPPSKRFNSRKSDIRFSIGGVRGAANLDKAEEVTTRLDNLNVARQMEEAKKDAKTIKVATGWERGADGKWRYEMPDFKFVDSVDLSNRFKHRDLYHIMDAESLKRIKSMYYQKNAPLPEVHIQRIHAITKEDEEKRKNDVLAYVDKENSGKVNLTIALGNNYWNGNTVDLSSAKVQSTLNHELQHIIQIEEGFATGGNPMNSNYENLAGEVEARNVQKRLGMTDEERRNSLAAETEDVARKDQIFMGVDNVKYSLKEVNDKFNAELDRYVKGEMKSSEMLHLGNPNGVMKNFLPDLPVVMRQRILTKGSIKKHNIAVESLADMPKHLAHPIFVFKRSDNALGVLTEMKDRDGKNVCVAIELNRQIQDGGDILEVNDIRSVHGRDVTEIIYPIVQNGTLKWVDKEKGLAYLSSASRYVQQEIDKQNLKTAAKLVKDFKNPSISEENSPSEQKFSLRVNQYQHDLDEWKKNNNLPKDAQRPSIPVREPSETAAEFAGRVKEYRKQMALWKTAPQYEDHLLVSDTAQGEFNRELQRGSVLARIALQDSMLAIRKAQEAIMHEVGVDKLNMAEDAYTAENRSHGKGKNEFEEYNNEFLQPLRKAYNAMMKKLGKSYDNVKIYMIAKHGLERNAHMAFMKALDSDYEKPADRIAAYQAYKGDMDRLNNDADFVAGRIDFTTWRQRDNAIRTKYAPSFMDYRYDKMGIANDYSGLSALFDGSDFEEAAADMVKDVESKNPSEAQDLWDATHAATKKILRDSYKAGMMTKDVYEYVRGMYQNYIPLRGWGDTNADQVWNYMGGGKGAFNQTLKKANGRGSLADDPIAYIENMAESGILINNKNWVKQHLLLLAQNHPTSLLNVSKAWYIKTVDAQGNEEWIPASPYITEDMTSQQVEAELEAFEKRMEQMKQNGDATQKREHLEISYPQTNGEKTEHEVRVMKDGEEYVIYINGDPQLAQAMNNTRAHRVREGLENSISQKAIAKLGRFMAAAYTSLSPLFIPSNYARDLTMTLASSAIREDARYNYLLRKNLALHWNMYGMVRDYQSGKLREKVRNGNATKTEQMFYDYMMNGGETGFVSSMDVEALKKKFKNELRDMNRMALNPKKVGHFIMDEIETLNRAIEGSNRFAVYRTSVEYGRSIEEAVNNAKDVTLNFNRKGTGEHGWQTIRNLYLFINPAVQSLQTLGALAKHHPFKFTAVTTAWLASGVLVPIINGLAMSMLGGDDDKDKYWSFTKWDRRNNMILWVPGTHEFIKIPLAQEFRGFYGVGDMIASKLMGGEKAQQTWEEYAEDMMGQVIDMLPLDPTGYDGNVAVSLMPNPIRPFFELAFNVDFTGKPLFKQSEYNKYDPNFTKAYAGTPDWLVRISRMVNSVGNDYPDFQQNAIDKWGDPRFNLNNPAVVDHILSSYLGGAYTMGSQILGVATKLLNGDEVKVADVPLVSKFVSNPDDRPVSKKQGDEFWLTKERHDRAARTLSQLKKKAKVDGDYSTLEVFFDSDEYKQYKKDDAVVKKYQEDKKAEAAKESGDEYTPKKLTADKVYEQHATTKDDFEDLMMSQLYTKANGYRKVYEANTDILGSGKAYYEKHADAIQAAEDVEEIRKKINDLKKNFLSDDGKDSYNAEDMNEIRNLRTQALTILKR
jgi:hypothetical protein